MIRDILIYNRFYCAQACKLSTSCQNNAEEFLLHVMSYAISKVSHRTRQHEQNKGQNFLCVVRIIRNQKLMMKIAGKKKSWL